MLSGSNADARRQEALGDLRTCLALAEAIAHLHEGELILQDNQPGLLTALQLPIHSQQPRAA